jgi:hypothetical protein
MGHFEHEPKRPEADNSSQKLLQIGWDISVTGVTMATGKSMIRFTLLGLYKLKQNLWNL